MPHHTLWDREHTHQMSKSDWEEADAIVREFAQDRRDVTELSTNEWMRRANEGRFPTLSTLHTIDSTLPYMDTRKQWVHPSERLPVSNRKTIAAIMLGGLIAFVLIRMLNSSRSRRR